MEDLIIKGTNRTPEVNFRKDGLIELRGVSTLENPEPFYKPLINWIEEYVKNPADKTVVNLDMEYYNTSSQMWIFQILELLRDLAKVKTDVELNWYYFDEEMQELGEDLESLLHIKFNFVQKHKE